MQVERFLAGANRTFSGARRAVSRVVVLGLLVVLPGCDPGSMVEAPPSAICTAIGQRCQRPDGPIGVCQVRPCPPGESGPCYVCTPQH